MGLFNDYESGNDVIDAINKGFNDGTYAVALRIYPHLNMLFDNIDTIRSQVEIIKNTAEDIPIECPQEKAIRKLSYRIRDMLNDIIRSYKYPSISEIPSGVEMELLASDMKKFDEILHIVEETKSNNGSEETDMKNNNITTTDDTIKETMQKSIDACTNSIKLDDLCPADDEPEVGNKDKKLVKACDAICDIGLAITAASTVALAVKATKTKKVTGKYNPIQLAGCAMDGYILGKNMADVIYNMPNTVTSRAAKKIASAAKKLASKAVKSIRKEVE